MRFLYHASDDFQRLHACLSHHSRNDAADRISLFFPKRSCPEFPDHMPGDADVANHIRSECIRCHIPVSKSDDQHRFFPFSHQTFQMFCQFLRYFPVIILIRCRHIRGFHGNICPDRFPHRFCPVFCLDHHPGRMDLQFFIVLLFNPHTPDFYVIFFKTFSCFQCEVCSDTKSSKHALFPPAVSFFCLILFPSDLLLSVSVILIEIFHIFSKFDIDIWQALV